MEEAQAQVKVHTISTVAPTIPTERHSMFLSNLDLLWLPINNVQRILFYTISPENQYSSIVESLKKSLSSVLVYFYPLAGRLDKGESGRPEIDCNDAGVEFLEASIDMPFSSLERDGFQYKPFFQNLVPKVHPLQDHNCSTPFLSVQVTSFEEGGICIGTTLHHVIADGNSCWHFMKSWAECSRGLPVSNPPLHCRTVFKLENKKPIPISYKPHDVVINGIPGAQIYKFLPDDLQQNSEKTSAEQALELEVGIQKWLGHNTEPIYSTFCFTEKMIRDLKQQNGTSSSFIAVAAQFWRCLTRAREVPDEEPVVFALLADCRSRVKPPLPKAYFGNCLSSGIVRTAAKTLLGNNLCFAASLIQELINFCTTEEQIKNTVDWLESPDSGLAWLFHEFAGLCFTNVVSSHRFPVYEIDYGWGRPLNVQTASINENGAMVLFAAKDDGGSIVVSTRLPKHQMEILTHLLSVPH
ncbi:hydroxycinnamoyltransferase [Cryptomeria japonica]|uniref:hydroxycinnamoyltransferase n=1 Tax=Cryptomeria japonica TaxID=3369 RepID=UPI0027DA7B50|nr:hydroxycinnamoyltransferase [Cryptomeria japonica]